MSLKLGDTFPNYKFQTTQGEFNFHDWLGDSWAILFSHPADYTPVCTTELGAVAKQAEDFKKLGVKLIGYSIDTVSSHEGWIKDIEHYNGLACGKFPYPIIAGSRKQAADLGMLDPDEVDKAGLPVTARCVFVLKDKKLKLSLLYPATTGRNIAELLRVVKSLQLTMEKKVATPANWQPGDKCMVIPSIKDDEAKKLFPKGFETAKLPSEKAYIRLTPDPSS
ncbi:peroxiredoxin-6-like [Styela clava]